MTSGRSGAESREAILEAATRLIRAKGVAGVSISDITAASGTSTGAVYHHFANKHAIVLAVAHRAVSGPMASALAEQGDVSPQALFELAISRVMAEESTADLLLQVWAGALTDPQLKEQLVSVIAVLHVGVAGHIRVWCAERGVEAESMGRAEVLVGLLLGFALQRSLFPLFGSDAYLELAGRALQAV